MDRIVVVGTSGSGKTTVGKRVAEILGLPHIELDSLHWGPDWQPRDAKIFEREVARAVSCDKWLIDGNYSRVRGIIWSRATHVIWLNYSFIRVMYQLLSRTLNRGAFNKKLYSGNRESLRRSLFSRESILLWAARTFHRRRREYRALRDSGDYTDIEFIELRDPTETEVFLHFLESDH